MGIDVLGQNDTYVKELRDSINDGVSGLCHVPKLLKNVLKNERWKERRIRSGATPRFDRFEDFVTTKPLEGLGGTMDLIKKLCEDDPETLDLLDRAIQGRQGERTDLLDNIQEVEPAPTGTSKQAAIRRLRDQRPDLHARVLAGKLSPHAAMVEAGFRQKSVTIPSEPEAAARRLARHFRGERLEALIEALGRHRGEA